VHVSGLSYSALGYLGSPVFMLVAATVAANMWGRLGRDSRRRRPQPNAPV